MTQRDVTHALGTGTHGRWANNLAHTLCSGCTAPHWNAWRSPLQGYCAPSPDPLPPSPPPDLQRLYRAPLDRLEESTTGMADLVLVNR